MNRYRKGGFKMRLIIYLFFSGILILFYSWEKEEMVGIDPDIVTGNWKSSSSYQSESYKPIRVQNHYKLSLNDDNTFQLAEKKGVWLIQGNELVLNTTQGPGIIPNTFKIKNFSNLTISLEMKVAENHSGGSDNITLVFQRIKDQPTRQSTLANLFE